MKETSIEVVVERIQNFKEIVEKGFSGVHRRLDDVDANQKYTNGKVRRVELWKAGLATGLTVTIFVASYALSDYYRFKTAIYEYEKSNAIANEQLKEQKNQLENLSQAMIDIQKQQSSLNNFLSGYNINIKK